MADPTTHTGQAAQKLVDGVREDLEEIVGLLERALTKIRAVELDGKGVNGLAAVMKSKGNEIALTIEAFETEAASVARKMLHEPKAPAIHEHVDHEHAATVSAARELEG